jgi:LuxR family maltose regulon positive regulatory protein
LYELRRLVDERDRPSLRRFVDALEARLSIDTDEPDRAEALVARLRPESSARSLLEARLHVARGRPADACKTLDAADFTNLRDRLDAQLVHAHAVVVRGDDPTEHVNRVVELAAPERLVRMVLEEGDVIARLVRHAAEASGISDAQQFAVALGSPGRRRRRDTDGIVAFSDRERDVLRFLPTRLTNQDIANECFMSVNTVKAHLKGIYTKLGVSSRAEAVERARLLGEL